MTASKFPDEPESNEIPVPDTMSAVCAIHGPIAQITIGPDWTKNEGPHWVVRCGLCGRSCSLKPASPSE